jgi:hypothetical protein
VPLSLKGKPKRVFYNRCGSNVPSNEVHVVNGAKLCAICFKATNLPLRPVGPTPTAATPTPTPTPVTRQGSVNVTNKGNVIALITRVVNGVRYMVPNGTKRVKASRRFFRFQGAYYWIDTRLTFLYGKAPYLIYDVDVSEPMELTPAVGLVSVRKPFVYNENCHFSKDLEMYLKDDVIVKLANGINRDKAPSLTPMMILLLVMGIVMGYFIGVVLPFHLGPATATNSTVTHTVSGLIRSWLT